MVDTGAVEKWTPGTRPGEIIFVIVRWKFLALILSSAPARDSKERG